MVNTLQHELCFYQIHKIIFFICKQSNFFAIIQVEFDIGIEDEYSTFKNISLK